MRKNKEEESISVKDLAMTRGLRYCGQSSGTLGTVPSSKDVPPHSRVSQRSSTASQDVPETVDNVPECHRMLHSCPVDCYLVFGYPA